ncbi:hypothetical protein [Niabella drilacis]|uniref:Uncharacterized protein n=1 Tax=Niabella drilacis (strain DSM 25811 / CCM 8410 / CCUG 62505 / LMG 26954 / E90) TaxID=1285928 RepID=A0A1G6T7W6_NIADE|nr:hypothetical protein [Niabella drilacis]SDD25093.1 hypothetical protein SAMN04487894_107127 [Niabella drilacis]
MIKAAYIAVLQRSGPLNGCSFAQEMLKAQKKVFNFGQINRQTVLKGISPGARTVAVYRYGCPAKTGYSQNALQNVVSTLVQSRYLPSSLIKETEAGKRQMVEQLPPQKRAEPKSQTSRDL